MVNFNIREEHIDLGKSRKAIILTDIHAHEYKPFSKPTSEGVGSRFLWIMKALDTIFEYALDNQIYHLFFLGDLFHHRTIMYSIVFEMTARKIEEASAKGLHFHFILGNHDFIFNNDASPSVIKKIKTIDVIENPTLYTLRNLDEKIGALKFYFNPELLVEELIELNKVAKERTAHLINDTNYDHTLLGHFELIGASISDEYILQEPLSPVIFDPTIFQHIFSGHIHKAQTLAGPEYKKVVNFVGTPLQHRYNDENNPYGFAVLDFDHSNKFKTYIPLNSLGNFPEFKTVYFQTQEEVKVFTTNQSNKERFGIDYFRIRTDNNDLKLDNLFKKLSHYIHEDKSTLTQTGIEEQDNEKVELKFNLDVNMYFNLYLKELQATEDIEWVDKEKLSRFLDNVRVKGNIAQ